MTTLRWLASYPKSGNTWFRAILANLSGGDDPADINELPQGGGIASCRNAFEDHTLIDSGLLTHDEADRLRPAVYAALAQSAKPDAEPIAFLKTHDAYREVSTGKPLLAGARGPEAAILIVRDPRDVAPSFAHHNGMTLDQAIEAMANPAMSYCGSIHALAPQLRQALLDWSGHARSWLDQRDIPVHLLRYEDLEADPVQSFAAALAAVGWTVDTPTVERAVRLAGFEELSRQETEKSFRERSVQASGAFFRRGRSGGWRSELRPDQVERLERDHGRMMTRLGYRLATPNGVSRPPADSSTGGRARRKCSNM